MTSMKNIGGPVEVWVSPDYVRAMRVLEVRPNRITTEVFYQIGDEFVTFEVQATPSEVRERLGWVIGGA